MIILDFINIIFILLFLIFGKSFFYKYKLIDSPNNIKTHNKDIPLAGGVILFFSGLFFFFNNEFIFSEVIFLLIICLVGILDDRININANYKMILLIIILTFGLFFNQNLLIKYINFFYFDDLFFPNNLFLQYFITILCLLLLINAFNMIDGINGLASIIFISWTIYILFKTDLFSHTIINLIIIMSIFLIYNLKNIYFLGDGGNYFLSSFIGLLLLKTNSFNFQNFFAEEIFLLLMIPGLDMLRLFIDRLKNKKNPFGGDRNHLHHLLIRKFNNNQTLIIFLLLINLPIWLFNIFGGLNLIILISLVIYVILISVLKKGSDNEIRRH